MLSAEIPIHLQNKARNFNISYTAATQVFVRQIGKASVFDFNEWKVHKKRKTNIQLAVVLSWKRPSSNKHKTNDSFLVIFSQVPLMQLLLRKNCWKRKYELTRDRVRGRLALCFILLYFTASQGISPVIANEQHQLWLVALNDINRLMVTYGKVEGHGLLTGRSVVQMETI